MSFSATGAHRPLQSKTKKNPFLRRSSSSPFSNHPRRKSTTPAEPASLKRARTENDGTNDGERLYNVGIVTSLPPANSSQDVVGLLSFIRDNMFNDIPERSAGLNSVQIANILNFRKNLVPIVSLAHLHAVSTSSTATERGVSRLVQAGTIRRTAVLGRGTGNAAIGEGLVLVEDWERLVREDTGLDDQLKTKYISLLRDNPTSGTINASGFNGTEASELVGAGFLTSTSALSSNTELLSRPGAFSLGASGTVATAVTTAATGTLAAVGGSEAIHGRGGGGGGLHTASRGSSRPAAEYTFSLPSTGTYLRLLTEARAHLLQLLSKSSPKFKEASKDMLRERWNGGIPGDDPATRAKRMRGEWDGILPGRTKKWKSFYGMDFNWILEECLGSGAIECFHTGSVGLGVRAT